MSLSPAPDLQISLSLSSIQKFKSLALPMLLSQIGQVRIPDQTSKIKAWPLSTVITLSSISVSDISADTEQTKVAFMAPDMIFVHIESLRGNSSFHWKVSKPKSHGEGHFSLRATHVNACIRLGAVNGCCTVTIEWVQVYVRGTDLYLQGGFWSRLYEWISRHFNEKLNRLLETSLSNAIRTAGQKELNRLLSNFAVNAEYAGLVVSYGLVQPPIVGTDHITLATLARFQASSDSLVSPAGSGFLPEFDPTKAEIQVAISEYTLNSLLWAVYSSGYMTHTLSSFPSQLPIQLNTSSLNRVFPGIESLYGPNSPCSLTLTVTSAPILTIKPGHMQGKTTVKCVISVQNSIPAVTFDLTLLFTASFSLQNWEITAHFQSIDVLDISAYMGTTGIDSNWLKFMLDMGLKGGLGYINKEVLKQGLKLPRHMSLDSSEGSVKLEDGYVFVEASPFYRRETH